MGYRPKWLYLSREPISLPVFGGLPTLKALFKQRSSQSASIWWVTDPKGYFIMQSTSKLCRRLVG